MDWSRPSTDSFGALFSHFFRFFSSRHSRDLMIIAAVAFVLVILVVLQISPTSPGDPSSAGGFRRFLSDNTAALAFVGGGLGVIGWAYQAANLRFGVADIFAAEIATICRVAAVGDLMPILVDRYIDGKPLPPITVPLVVFEDIFKDLEVLDSNVVGAVTEFYMYLRELQSALEGAHEPAPGGAEAAAHPPPHRHRSLHAIYNAFLAFESARNAIGALVDDGELRQEHVLTALQGELPAYFLLYMEYAKAKEDDVRHKRIVGRLPGYQGLIESLKDLIASLKEKNTPQARRIRDLASRVTDLWDESVDGKKIGFSHRFLTPAIDAETRRTRRAEYLWTDGTEGSPGRIN
jgi:hypothetical protein